MRREFLLLTDDCEALMELLEALGIDPAPPPSMDPEIFSAAEKDWRAPERRARETNTVAFSFPLGRRGAPRRPVLECATVGGGFRLESAAFRSGLDLVRAAVGGGLGEGVVETCGRFAEQALDSAGGAPCRP